MIKRFLCFFIILQSTFAVAQQDTINNQLDSAGKKTGLWLTYHPNGMVASVENYKANALHGALLLFSDRGFLEAETHYYEGEPHGDHRYFRFGYLTKFEQYKRGKLDGVYETYDRNNKILERHFYQNGKKHGLSTWYNESGTISFQYRYEDGKIEGQVLIFHANSKLKSKTNYENNEKHGTFEEYFESGTIKTMGQFKRGKEVGTWISYNEKGEITLKEKK